MRLKLSIIFLCGLLSACGSTPKQVKKPEPLTPQPEITEPSTNINTAATLFDKAAKRRGADRIQLLYSARDAALDEKAWGLLNQIITDLNRRDGSNRTKNTLLQAYANAKLGQFARAKRQLDGVQNKLINPNQYYWHQLAMGEVYLGQQQTAQAMPFLMRASEAAHKHSLEDDALLTTLWQTLKKLPQSTLNELNTGSAIQRGWVNLALYTQVYLGDSTALEQALNNWQRRYPDHPGTRVLPADRVALVSLAPFTINRLAVLLPQTGRYANVAQHLLSGVTAALDSHSFEEVRFIDSQLSSSEISLALTEFNPDFVIGPLIKEHLNKVKDANLLQNYPSLILNTSEQSRTSLEHFYFALAPEHEIQQGVHHFVAADYQNPLVLAPSTPSGERLTAYFSQQWRTYTDSEPLIGFYENSKDMEATIKSVLEVSQSERRIKRIRSLFTKVVDAETRSRRDIDAIYILGDAIQTRLVKPFIDVNVSTFATKIPLYASSKSHSFATDKTDKRDLAGLYFTEIPWMLPFNYQKPGLRKDYDALYDEAPDLAQRLFAMGVDAVNLVPHLRQLATLEGKQFAGLTGALSLDNSGYIQRRLQWAQYRNRDIIKRNLKDDAPAPKSTLLDLTFSARP